MRSCDYEKDVEFDYATVGITGQETGISLSLMQLHTLGDFLFRDYLQLRWSARISRLQKGRWPARSGRGRTVFDPDRSWVFRRDESAVNPETVVQG